MIALMPGRTVFKRAINLVAVLQIKIFGLKIESIKMCKSCPHSLCFCFYLVEQKAAQSFVTVSFFNKQELAI